MTSDILMIEPIAGLLVRDLIYPALIMIVTLGVVVLARQKPRRVHTPREPEMQYRTVSRRVKGRRVMIRAGENPADSLSRRLFVSLHADMDTEEREALLKNTMEERGMNLDQAMRYLNQRQAQLQRRPLSETG